MFEPRSIAWWRLWVCRNDA